jgi:hypothetical protein
MRDSSSPQATAALTQTEALRQAIAALGYRAPVADILAYVRDHFGIGESAAVAPAPAPPAASETAKRPAPKRGKNKDRADPSD